MRRTSRLKCTNGRPAKTVRSAGFSFFAASEGEEDPLLRGRAGSEAPTAAATLRRATLALRHRDHLVADDRLFRVLELRQGLKHFLRRAGENDPIGGNLKLRHGDGNQLVADAQEASD